MNKFRASLMHGVLHQRCDFSAKLDTRPFSRDIPHRKPGTSKRLLSKRGQYRPHWTVPIARDINCLYLPPNILSLRGVVVRQNVDIDTLAAASSPSRPNMRYSKRKIQSERARGVTQWFHKSNEVRGRGGGRGPYEIKARYSQRWTTCAFSRPRSRFLSFRSWPGCSVKLLITR